MVNVAQGSPGGHRGNGPGGKTGIHLVSAFAADHRLVLGQLATEAKSNEITAIPKLLELLDLQDATVTIDAMGCQKDIARQIIAQGGDYVLAVKENQPTLHAQVKALLDEAIVDSFKGLEGDYFEETDGGHGRIEVRKVWCTPEVQWLRQAENWPELRGLVVVESHRQALGESSVARRYYISSRPGTDAQVLAGLIRGHWGIENQVHWQVGRELQRGSLSAANRSCGGELLPAASNSIEPA